MKTKISSNQKKAACRLTVVKKDGTETKTVTDNWEASEALRDERKKERELNENSGD